MIHFQAAVCSLRKALQKTMVLPDIYKPVCNSEKLALKHKYRSCKVNDCMLSSFQNNARNQPVVMRAILFGKRDFKFVIPAYFFSTSIPLLLWRYITYHMVYKNNLLF